MKVIFKNTSLVFQQQVAIEWRSLTVKHGSFNAQTGLIVEDTNQSSPTSSSRYISTEYIDVTQEPNVKVTVSGYAGTPAPAFVILFYDASKNYIGLVGDNWVVPTTFTSGQEYNVLDDFDTFSHYESGTDVPVSKATIQANAKYFRIGVRYPTPLNEGSSVTIAVG